MNSDQARATAYELPAYELASPLVSGGDAQDMTAQVGAVTFADGMIYYSIECFIPMAQFPSLGVFVATYDMQTGEASVIYAADPFFSVGYISYHEGFVCWGMETWMDGQWRIMQYEAANGETTEIASSYSPAEHMGFTMFSYPNYILWYEYTTERDATLRVYSKST